MGSEMCIRDRTIDSLTSSITNLERSNQRMESDLEEIQLDYERVHAAAIINEQKGRNFDKVSFEFLDYL